MTPPPDPPHQPYRSDETRTLTGAKALTAMAHPVRSRMLDALRVDGPSTASILAQRTGQAVGSASHHLKVLAEADLVEEAPELARDRRERWWRLVSAGTRWSRHEFAQDSVAVAAAREAEAVAFRRQIARSQEWMVNAESDPEWDAAAFTTQSWLRLTPAEAEQYAEEIVALSVRWSRRELPADDQDREPYFFFARGFPSQP